jgi:hypothetical protein
MEERPLGGELLALAGRASGGLLTSDDLSSPRPDVQKAARIARTAERGVVTFPWTHIESDLPVAPAHAVDIARVRAVAAVDRNATFAIACWDDATDGLLLPDLGLRAPFLAEPVRRGQTRIRPGDIRPAAGPVALVGAPGSPDIAFCAFGAGDAYDVLAQALRGYVEDDRIEAHGEARLIAVSHAKGIASVLRG